MKVKANVTERPRPPLMVYLAMSSSIIEFQHNGQPLSPFQIALDSVRQIRASGNALSYDWTETVSEEETYQNEKKERIVSLVIDSIKISDCLIFIPTPKFRSFGAPYEIGVALATGLSGGVIISKEFCPMFDHFLLHHRKVRYVDNLQQAIDFARILVPG